MKEYFDFYTLVPRYLFVLATSSRHIGIKDLREIYKESKNINQFILLYLGKSLVYFSREAGPLFIKMGQILATREDLVGKDLAKSLGQLFNKQPALAYKLILKIIKSQNIIHNFEEINPKPLGVGSIGQVHAAKLKDGSEVVIKIRHQEIEKKLARDIVFFESLLKNLKLIPSLKDNVSIKLLEQLFFDLTIGLRDEIDFNHEARQLKYFRDNSSSNKIVIPKVFEELSNSEILVMERLKGVAICDLSNDVNDEEKKRISEIALREILEQVFIDGRFHADPHSGNLLLLEDGRIGFIDLGLTGEFTRNDRKKLLLAVKAFITQDTEKTFDALLDFGIVPDNFEKEKFKNSIVEVYKLFMKERSEDNQQIQFDKLVNELFKVAYSYGIHVPRQTVLFIKSLITIEGVAHSLNPEINVKKIATSVILYSWIPKMFR